VHHRWKASAAAFSLAVGVKMNILLYAPAFALLWLQSGGARMLATNATICCAVQLVLGAPFLLASPREYIAYAFNLGRAFDHTWSVNWGWVPSSVFSSPAFAAS